MGERLIVPVSAEQSCDLHMTIGSNYVGSLSDSWDNSARNKVSRRQHLQQCVLMCVRQ